MAEACGQPIHVIMETENRMTTYLQCPENQMVCTQKFKGYIPQLNYIYNRKLTLFSSDELSSISRNQIDRQNLVFVLRNSSQYDHLAVLKVCQYQRTSKKAATSACIGLVHKITYVIFTRNFLFEKHLSENPKPRKWRISQY